MEQTISERLAEILKSKRYSVNALSKELNINQKTLNNQLTGKSALSVDVVCAIIKRFPELSADWILFGSEPIPHQYKMEAHVLQVNDEGDNPQAYHPSGSSDCHQLIDMLQEKDRQIAELIDIIKRK